MNRGGEKRPKGQNDAEPVSNHRDLFQEIKNAQHCPKYKIDQDHRNCQIGDLNHQFLGNAQSFSVAHRESFDLVMVNPRQDDADSEKDGGAKEDRQKGHADRQPIVGL